MKRSFLAGIFYLLAIGSAYAEGSIVIANLLQAGTGGGATPVISGVSLANGGNFTTPASAASTIDTLTATCSAGSCAGATLALATTGACGGAASADNGSFAILGNSLKIGASTVSTARTYLIGIAVTLAGATGSGTCYPKALVGAATGAPTGSCSQSTAFFARVWALPATLNGTVGGTAGPSNHVAVYDNMICALVTNGNWTTLDAFYFMSTNTATGTNTAVANLNLVSSSFTLVPHGAPAFTADTGYLGVDGSNTVYLDTGFNASTAGGNYALNSGTLFAWLLTGTIGSSGGVAIGVTDGTNIAQIAPYITGGTSYAWANAISSNSENDGGSVGTAMGSWTITRTSASGSGATTFYHTGLSISSGASASSIIPAGNIYVLAANNGAGSQSGSGRQTAVASIGAGRDAAHALSFYNTVCTAITALHGSC